MADNSICTQHNIISNIYRFNNLDPRSDINIIANNGFTIANVNIYINCAICTYACILVHYNSAVMPNKKAGSKIVGIYGEPQFVT